MPLIQCSLSLVKTSFISRARYKAVKCQLKQNVNKASDRKEFIFILFLYIPYVSRFIHGFCASSQKAVSMKMRGWKVGQTDTQTIERMDGQT